MPARYGRNQRPIAPAAETPTIGPIELRSPLDALPRPRGDEQVRVTRPGMMLVMAVTIHELLDELRASALDERDKGDKFER